MNAIAFAALGYLLGSIPFAILSSRLFGLADPRTVGSGNPGATNVLRSGNKLAALLTLLGDAGKGWLAMWLAAKLGADVTGIALTAVAAFLGHVFSVFLRFKGGKGVATAAGLFFGFSPWLGLCVLGVWLAAALISRYSSLGALCAAASAPFFAWWLVPEQASIMAVTVIAAVVIRRHRDNIQRLLAGARGKMGKKRQA